MLAGPAHRAPVRQFTVQVGQVHVGPIHLHRHLEQLMLERVKRNDARTQYHYLCTKRIHRQMILVIQMKMETVVHQLLICVVPPLPLRTTTSVKIQGMVIFDS